MITKQNLTGFALGTAAALAGTEIARSTLGLENRAEAAIVYDGLGGSVSTATEGILRHALEQTILFQR